jgi:hypothetical protein
MEHRIGEISRGDIQNQRKCFWKSVEEMVLLERKSKIMELTDNKILKLENENEPLLN